MDEGAGWRDDRPLPHLKGDTWNWVSTGPGHGIQLTRGAHHGRLVVTGDHRDDLGTPLDASDDIGGGQLYYSDDGGLTWNLGARHATSIRSTTVTVTNPGELAVVERTDGSLYVNARSSAACGYDERRLAALSTDGGQSFSGLSDPSVPGSVRAPFDRVPVSVLDAPPVFGSCSGCRPRTSAAPRTAYCSRLRPAPAAACRTGSNSPSARPATKGPTGRPPACWSAPTVPGTRT
ncbi:exo-alpha-sialidase [Streptomyces zhihengii]